MSTNVLIREALGKVVLSRRLCPLKVIGLRARLILIRVVLD